MAPNDKALNPERLAEIRARVEATSPGPWRFDANRAEIYSPNGHLIADVWEPTHESENAEFIAHAPEDTRALLAEIERLQRRVAELGRLEISEIRSHFTGNDPDHMAQRHYYLDDDNALNCTAHQHAEEATR